MPDHHPSPDELLAYAAGTSEPWLSTLMACHLTLCPQCRQELVALEDLAGAMFDELGAELEAPSTTRPVSVGPWPPKPTHTHAPEHPRIVVPDEVARQVPRPLHGFFADPNPHFRFLAPGLKHIPLTLEGGGLPVRLVRFKPGFVIPEHSHGDLEWMLILRGEVTCTATGERYARGDVSRRGAEDIHGMVISKDEPCVAAFAYIGGPATPRTLVGRVLAKIVGI